MREIVQRVSRRAPPPVDAGGNGQKSVAAALKQGKKAQPKLTLEEAYTVLDGLLDRLNAGAKKNPDRWAVLVNVKPDELAAFRKIMPLVAERV